MCHADARGGHRAQCGIAAKMPIWGPDPTTIDKSAVMRVLRDEPKCAEARLRSVMSVTQACDLVVLVSFHATPHSASRRRARAAGFLTLIQQSCRPPISRAMPPQPSAQVLNDPRSPAVPPVNSRFRISQRFRAVPWQPNRVRPSSSGECSRATWSCRYSRVLVCHEFRRTER